ncbi:unnamed protein product [Schistosoma haematobium]|nr:unnamed protein product [Schistosoma haematobium]
MDHVLCPYSSEIPAGLALTNLFVKRFPICTNSPCTFGFQYELYQVSLSKPVEFHTPGRSLWMYEVNPGFASVNRQHCE